MYYASFDYYQDHVKLTLEKGEWIPEEGISARWETHEIVATVTAKTVHDAAVKVLLRFQSHDDFEQIARAVVSATYSSGEANGAYWGR